MHLKSTDDFPVLHCPRALLNQDLGDDGGQMKKRGPGGTGKPFFHHFLIGFQYQVGVLQAVVLIWESQFLEETYIYMLYQVQVLLDMMYVQDLALATGSR